jgi:hypothetical protein
MSPANAAVELGKIVKSDSHVRYMCQIFAAGEVSAPQRPVDFAFGSFVRLPLRAAGPDSDVATLAPATPLGSDAMLPVPTPSQWAVGVIYDTILVNPAFGAFGPRLSNETQVELFSPDYVAERAVLVSILLLGTLTEVAPLTANGSNGRHVSTPRHIVRHGVPPIAPELGAVVSTLPEAEVRAFHFYADSGHPSRDAAYLHMGYLPHVIAQDNPLLPMAVLQIIERLEDLFPANASLLSIVKRNFAWRLKVETAG